MCGWDGKSYQNKLWAQCSNVKIRGQGKCSDSVRFRVDKCHKKVLTVEIRSKILDILYEQYNTVQYLILNTYLILREAFIKKNHFLIDIRQ